MRRTPTTRQACIRAGCVIALGHAAGLALAQPQFDQCLAGLRELAVERGVGAATASRVLADVQPLERVIAADRSQPEFVDTFADYLGRRVTAERVMRGRKLLQEHRALLARLRQQHGIPGQYLLAFWALETNYGRFLGSVPIFDALATLACDQRRSEYFSTELVNALHIAERGDVEVSAMRGSWAGAMGHTQFMPSAYLDHAVDGDGDNRVDLWASVPDALTSAATYLASLNWQTGMRWGREVRLPQGFSYALAGSEERRPLSEWRELGVTDVFGAAVVDLEIDASLLLPSGRRGPAFLVYDNFRAIMRWNRSEYFALTVGHLADRIAGAGGLSVPPPEDLRVRREHVAALQLALNARGHDSGAPDGRLGPLTRRAIRAFQESLGMAADGYPDAELLSVLGITRD